MTALTLKNLRDAIGFQSLMSSSCTALPTYSVFLIGFSPGFPYLGPLDSRLHAPRLDTPRPRVPAGSVAIGGEHTGIYSVASPGGWWLIGRTDSEIFSVSKGAGCREQGGFPLSTG